MGWGRPAPLRCELNLPGRPCWAGWVNKDVKMYQLSWHCGIDFHSCQSQDNLGSSLVKGCLVHVGNGIELDPVGRQSESGPYLWLPYRRSNQRIQDKLLFIGIVYKAT